VFVSFFPLCLCVRLILAFSFLNFCVFIATNKYVNIDNNKNVERAKKVQSDFECHAEGKNATRESERERCKGTESVSKIASEERVRKNAKKEKERL